MRSNFGVILALSLIIAVSGCTSKGQSNIEEHTLEIEDPVGEGEVSPSVGIHNFTEGDSALLKANAKGSWEFVGWEINDSIISSSSEVNLSITSDKKVKPIFKIPAKFEVKEFEISKKKVDPNEENTASVTISNTGGSKGTYKLVLSSDKTQYESRSIELEANNSESIDIRFREDEEAVHNLKVEDKEQTFTVDSATFISDAESFNDIRNDLDGEYKLTSNIDLSNIDSEEFTPIGDGDNKFTGLLEGQGYSVSNYVINSPESNYVGLFGFLGDQGQIKNLDVNQFSVVGDEYVGGLAAVNNGEISNLSASGNVAGVQHVGGLVGHNWDNGRIIESRSDASVDGERYIGGLVGDNDNLISDSSSSGTIDGFGWVGGLVGRDKGEIVDSASDAEVSGSKEVAYGEASMEELNDNSEELNDISYEGLMRNPSENKNKLITFEGLITQIIDDENIRNYHVYTDYSTGYRGVRYWNSGRIKSYWKTEHVEEDYTTFDIEGERLLQEDLVRVYGIFRGLHTYETTQGDTNTVPNVEIRHIEQIEQIE